MRTPIFMLQAIGISLVISFIFNSVFFIRFFVGGKALLSLIRGKYHNVREEKLIVFFIDMASSTKLGESLSPKLFFSLLSDFMYVVETCTSSYGGFIYKYLGDGAIITWKAGKHSFPDALATVREMKLTIEDNAQYFSTKYGQAISASAGLHYGQVMVGELGEERRELGYLGDTVNTASRLQSACHDFEAWVLVSRAFYEGLNSNKNIAGISNWKEMGNLRLKGKQEEVSVLEPQFN
jgi:adenylate cyclase